MKNKIFILVVVLLLSLCFKNVSASELCSTNGYTILTINGIFTDENGARQNKVELAKGFPPIFNKQPLTVDYLYNPTHLAGVGDLVDAVKQGLFDQKSDYDLVEMLNDASQKITTQKVLLVAHSQGNFYANNFYDKVASQEGGVPSQSIGVYGVASPASRVAGEGKYLTSDTDNVIATMVARFIKILPTNTHIVFQNSDDKDGHDFTKIYLKYQGDRIVSDIKLSLDKLKNNDEQDSKEPCLSPPELSTLHKIQGVILAVADPTANAVRGGLVITYKTGVVITNTVKSTVSLLAGSLKKIAGNLAGNNGGAGVILSDSGAYPNTDSANPANSGSSSAPKSPTIPQVIDKIKTFAMGIFDPNFALAENNGDSSLPPVAGDANNSGGDGENTGGGGGGGGSSSGGGGGGGDPLPSEPTPDIIPPVITILGDNPVEITKDSIYTDAGATALDDIDGVREVITTGVIDMTTIGSYTVTYTATDLSENVATVTRTVNVVALPLPDPVPDITPPIITILGDNPVEITKDTIYTDAGATVLDDVDGARDVVPSGTVDVTIIGVYTITYTATDLSGNVATATRTINVVALPLPPPPVLNTVTINENTTLAPGEYNYDNLIVTNNAILTLEGDPASVNSFKGVKITAVNLMIDPGAAISVDQKGYGLGQGSGASLVDGIGASYGGVSFGGISTSIYGSATKPIDLGSAGGVSNSQGGGAVQIVVSDTFNNNGIVSADGGAASSGGSIYVSAKNITGNGILRANGGGLYASGYFKSPGGGGRIALHYKTSSFNGTMEAKGGCGQYDGMTMSCGQNGTIGLFDETANDLYLNYYWQFRSSDGPFSFNNIFISNGAKVESENDVNITANNILVDKISQLTLAENQILNIPTITINGSSTLILSGAETITANSLFVTENSMITVLPEKILSLAIPNITVDSGSSISADAKGYASGPGSPSASEYFAGASHGGIGEKNTSALTYGNLEKPIDFGSGGGAPHAKGGGAIRLVVANMLTNNGIISALGNISSSGGSVYVTAENISGSGTFSANGGGLGVGGYFSGSGGGGRTALYYKTLSFNGTIEAKGGCGSYDGWSKVCAEDGTVHVVDESIVVIPPILSSAKIISFFNFASFSPEVAGVIDETNHTISLTVPFGTDVKTLTPAVTISEKASINPDNNIIQDFTNPITYVVTAEDNSTQNYIVTVTIAPDPNPIPDITPPSITSYTFNGVVGDITADPLTNPISIVLTASENVNWTSIKIENQNNTDIHKYFYDGANCVNGTLTCAKIWKGETIGGTLQNGIYKIKMHIKDLAGNEFYDYLFPYVINVIKEDAPPALE